MSIILGLLKFAWDYLKILLYREQSQRYWWMEMYWLIYNPSGHQ